MKRFLCLLVLGPVGLCAWAQTINVVPQSSYWAPPVAWGVPLEGGPLRAIIAAPERGMRDVDELAQRIELAPQAVALDAMGAEDAGAWLRERVAEGLTKSGGMFSDTAGHDLILLGGVGLASLPEDSIDALLDAVNKGMGLVYVIYDTPPPPKLQEAIDRMAPVDSLEPITRGLGESMTPEWREGILFLSAGTIGEGRVAVFDFGGPAPISHFLTPPLANPLLAEEEHFDVYYSIMARAVRWVAKHEPKVWIAALETVLVEPDKTQIPPELPQAYVDNMQNSVLGSGAASYLLYLNVPATENYQVESQLRQPGRNWQLKRTYTDLIPKGADSYALNLPTGPGDYFLDLWLRDENGRVVDWYTEGITVEGWPSISAVRLSRASVYPQDKVDVSVQTDAPRGVASVVAVRASDMFGRLVAQGEAPAPEGGGSTTIHLELSDLVARMLKIEAYAFPATNLPTPKVIELNQAAYAYAYLPVIQPSTDLSFSLVVRADGSAEHNQRAFLRTLASLGAVSAYAHGTEESGYYLAQAGLRPLYEIAHWTPETIVDGVVRVPSFADGEYQYKETERIRNQCSAIWGGESALYSLGDGNCLAAGRENACQSADSLAGFRKSLQQMYGGLDRLNASWRTQFERWEDVTPAPEEAASVLGAYAPWLDFRLFMDRQFTEMLALGRDAVRGARPDARAGFIARPGELPYLGYDWRALADGLSVLGVPPERGAIGRIGSYAAPSAFTPLCLWQATDSSKPEEDAAKPSDEGKSTGPFSRLKTAFRAKQPEGAAPSFAWYPWVAVMHGLNAVGWDASQWNCALDAKGEPTPEFRSLLDGLAPLQHGMGALLRDAKRTPSDIAIYDSQASRYLADILPKDAPELARQEGLETCLASLGYPSAYIAPADLATGKLSQYKVLALPCCIALSDTETVAIRTFQAAGGILLADVEPGVFDAHGFRRAQPALADLFAAPAGAKTTAIALWNRPENEDPTNTIRNAFTAAGLNPPAEISLSGTDRFPGCCTVWEYGEAKLYAFLREPDSSGSDSATVKLKDPRVLYNPLLGVKELRPKKVHLALPAGQAAVLTSLPYEVSDIVLETPDKTLTGRRLPVRISFKTSGGLPGSHLCYVTLEYLPMLGGNINSQVGSALPRYSRTAACPQGKGETYFPLAINEWPGKYLLRVRDVLTGISRETTLTVETRGDS